MEEIDRALEIALSIRFSDDQGAALAALLPHLPDALFHQARIGVESLDGAFPQVVGALVALARRLPANEQCAIWRKALTTACDLKNEHASESLTLVAPDLPNELLPQAVEMVEKLSRPYDRAVAVAALLPRLPMQERKPLLTVGMEAINQLGSGTDPLRVRCYAALLKNCPDDEADGVLATALSEASAYLH